MSHVCVYVYAGQYANLPASPALHNAQWQLIAASNLAAHDYSGRVRMGASACDSSLWLSDR